MKKFTFIWGLIIFLILGCSTEDEWSGPVDSGGLLLLNYQTMVRVSDDNLFLEVAEIDDKRCPIGVVCPANGVASIRLTARMNGEETTIVLQSGKLQDVIKCSGEIFNHRIEVVELNPYPYNGCPLEDKRGYQVKLKVESVD